MEIMYDVLKVLGDGGMPKTRLMQMALLSWYQLKEELDTMEKLQLLRFAENPDNKVYLTDKGQSFIKKYDKLIRIFDTRRKE